MQRLAELVYFYPYITTISAGAVVAAAAFAIAAILLQFERDSLEARANRSYRTFGRR